METVAYLQLAQDYENSELHELNFEPLKGKKFTGAIASVVGIASVAYAGGLLNAAPASANNNSCCQSQSVDYRPVCQSSCGSSQGYSSYDNSESYSSYYPNYSTSYESYSNSYPESYDSSYQSYNSGSSYNGCGCSSGASYNEVGYYPSSSLTVGARGEIVAQLQQALLSQGFDPGPVDGVYGRQTANAVAYYQSVAGLSVDGVAGGQTLDSLGLGGA